MPTVGYPGSGRRSVLLGALALVPALVPAVAGARGPGRPIEIEVWKDASCGCCKDWIAHLEKNGFAASVYDVGNAAVRNRLKMPRKYGSCHTALVGGYVVEGHVPAPDIRRLLEHRPRAVGLTAPGMPVGAPGMDGPEYGGRRDRYDVLLVREDGTAEVYKSYS